MAPLGRKPNDPTGKWAYAREGGGREGRTGVSKYAKDDDATAETHEPKKERKRRLTAQARFLSHHDSLFLPKANMYSAVRIYGTSIARTKVSNIFRWRCPRLWHVLWADTGSFTQLSCKEFAPTSGGSRQVEGGTRRTRRIPWRRRRRDACERAR